MATGPEAARVLTQVDKICNSNLFVRSERLCQFLRFITQETLEGRGANLKEYTIGAALYSKGDDFDTRTDSAVRVDARRLRAKLAEYYQGPGAGDPIRLELPKGGYVPDFVVATAPSPAVTSRPAPVKSSWIKTAAGVTAVALVGLGLWLWKRQLTPGEFRSIAVLPFTNMTGQSGNDALCDGLAEEIIDRLSHFPDRRVISRQSAFAYKGKHTDLRRVARELRADAVIDGSVRAGRDTFRITVQLVNGADGAQIWSEAFTVTPGDDVTVQEHVGRLIEARLTRQPPLGEDDQKIENLVLQAGVLYQRKTRDSLERAAQYAREASQARSTHAMARALLADITLALAAYQPVPQRMERVTEARQLAGEARKLNPKLGSPLATLGAIALEYEWQWHQAEELFREALTLNPRHAEAHSRLARLLSLQGRHDEAIAAARRAESLVPLSVTAKGALGQVLFLAGRFEEAITWYRKSLEMDPGYIIGRFSMIRALEWTGQREAAWRELRSVSPRVQALDEYLALHAWLEGRRGNRDQARRIAGQASRASAMSLAAAWASAGEETRAFQLLERAVRDHEPTILYLKVSPGLNTLRAVPKINELCSRVRLKDCSSSPPSAARALRPPSLPSTPAAAAARF